MQGAADLRGLNYGAGNTSRIAQAALPAVYIDLMSRGASHISPRLDGAVVYPGVWSSTVGYTLDADGTVFFDARGKPDAVFILTNTGALR